MNREPEKLIPGQDLIQCPICARRFNSNRAKIHETICQKLSGSKRKSFDSSQQRIRGTEIEKLTQDIAKLDVDRPPVLSTNWRRRHEDFINKIKVAKGSNNENTEDKSLRSVASSPDPCQCPHCLRKFNPASAQRHIAICAKTYRMSKSKMSQAVIANK